MIQGGVGADQRNFLKAREQLATDRCKAVTLMPFLQCLFYVIYCFPYYIFVKQCILNLLSVFLIDFGYSFNFTSGEAYEPRCEKTGL